MVFVIGCFIQLQTLAYEYPFEDPYLATVVGTPVALQGEIPKVKLRTVRLPGLASREVPRALWYGRKLEYSIARQKGPAPLIFAIAGTGGYHNSETNSSLMRAFYGAGFHVVGISSPTHPKFVIAASKTGVPGHIRNDAQDIYAVMQRVREDIAGKADITEYHMMGYSLGGMHAAFVAKLDDQEKVFNFKRVLMINPPVSLYSSISKLDRMLENIPGGVDNFNQYFSGIVRQIGDVYNRSTSVEFNQDLVYQAFKENPPTDEELAAIIGVAFRIAAANMIFTSDVMADFGFIKPKGVTLYKGSAFDDYLQVALRLGLTDYFHEFFWPFYQPTIQNDDRDAFARKQSLHSIADYLATTQKIGVVHNEDDVILTRNEIDFFREVFKERVTIYPHGGHLGNILQHETLGTIIAWFKP